MPYGGLTPLSLPKLLRDGDRMEIPDNQACSDEMLAHTSVPMSQIANDIVATCLYTLHGLISLTTDTR